MKRILYGAIAATFALCACDDTSSSTTTFDDDDDVIELSSSSIKNVSSSSVKKDDGDSSKTDSSEAKDPRLQVPSDFKATRLAPSVFKLEWNFETDFDRPESGFIVQSSSLEGGQWKSIDTVKADVHFYSLAGKDNIGKYFRVASYDKKGKSDFTTPIQISANAAYEENIQFNAPTLDIKVVTTKNNDYVTGGTASVSIGESPVTKSLSTNPYTESVKIEFNWIKAVTDSASKNDVTANATVALEKAVSQVKLSTHEEVCLSAYVQARVVWTDKNKQVDYSEWSKLTRIGDNAEGCPTSENGTTVDSTGAAEVVVNLATPTDLKALRLAPSAFKLEWSYTANADRIDTGFVIQSSENGSWKEIAKVKSGIYFYELSGDKFANKYYRVAAIDKKGTGNFSAPIEVSKDLDYANGLQISVPTLNLIVTTAKNAKNYVTGGTASASVSNTPATKSVVSSKYTKSVEIEFNWLNASLQTTPVKVNLSNAISETKLASHEEVCLSAYVQARVVWTDKNNETDISDWSNLIRIADKANGCAIENDDGVIEEKNPELQMPSNFNATRLAPSVWQLTWEFETDIDRPESGFIIDSLSDNNGIWGTAAKTNKGVNSYIVNGETLKENYYRIASYDNAGTSNFTTPIQVLESTEFRNDLSFNPPEIDLKVSTDSKENATSATASASIGKSIVTKNIEASKYTKSIDVEFNWVHSTADGSEVIHNVTLPLSRAISQKSITGHNEVCISTYVQARFIWTDVNDAQSYSDWSAYTRIGEKAQGCSN